MNDYLSEFLDEKPNQLASKPANATHSKEAKNVKATCRYLEVEGPGVHEFFQYSHFYKAKLESGRLILLFTNDSVSIEGTQSLLQIIAEEVSLHILPKILQEDPVHSEVLGKHNLISSLSVASI